MAAIVRLKTLDGRWETVGAQRLRGIWPEGLTLTSNRHGSDTARFILKRKTEAVYPDLSAFTPCEIEQDGTIVWSGRIWETPSKEGSDEQISVEGRGWQYHLDDDVFRIPFASTKLPFKDARQVLGANLQYFTAGGTVAVEQGTPVVGFGKGYEVKVGDTAAVVYDLGADYEEIWPYIFIELMSNLGNDTNTWVYVRLHNSQDPHSTGGTDFYDLMVENNSTFPRNTIKYIQTASSVARRYISIFVYSTAIGTFSDEHTVRINTFRVLGDTAYHAHVGDSQLRASDVAARSVREAAPQLADPTERTNRYADEIMGSPYVAGYWRFNGPFPDGDKDYSPYGRDLVSGAATITREVAGGLDNSLSTENDNQAFTYNGGYSSAALALQHNYFAIEGIFKPNESTAAGHVIAYVGDSGSNGWGLFLGQSGGAATANLWILSGGAAWYDTNIPITNGTWHWFNLTLLLNNTFVLNVRKKQSTGYQYVTSTSPAPIFASNMTFYVAGNSGAGSRALMDVDEMVVFSERFQLKITADDEMIRHQASAFDKSDGKIERTSFWIPDFPMEAAQTPREAIDAVNNFHDYYWKVDHEPALCYYAKPTAPKFEVGAWSGAEFEDASANAGEEIYNEVRVEGTDYLGDPLVITRGGLQPSDDHSLQNGTFDATTNQWTVSGTGYTKARDTTIYHDGSGSLRIDTDGSGVYGGVITTSFQGTFFGNRMYGFEGWAYRGSAASGIMTITVENTDGERVQVYVPPSTAGFWFKWKVRFLFSNYTGLSLNIEHGAGAIGSIVYLDTINVLSADDSLPSRRGFMRTKILPFQAALTPAAATKLGDVWLENHTSTPFKGALKHTHAEGVRTALGGAATDPAMMLNQTGERVRFSHRIDPDTGNWGREGTIDTVSYEGDTGISTITIDNTRQSFEALMGRLAAVVGNVR